MPESVLEAEGRKRARSCQEQTKVKEGLHSQCLTFFLSGCNGERTESEVGSPPQLLSVRLSVCLWWISVSREVWWDPKSFPSPSRPPAIFRGPVWFGWGPTKMWDLLIKDSKQLVVGGFW